MGSTFLLLCVHDASEQPLQKFCGIQLTGPRKVGRTPPRQRHCWQDTKGILQKTDTAGCMTLCVYKNVAVLACRSMGMDKGAGNTTLQMPYLRVVDLQVGQLDDGHGRAGRLSLCLHIWSCDKRGISLVHAVCSRHKQLPYALHQIGADSGNLPWVLLMFLWR